MITLHGVVAFPPSEVASFFKLTPTVEVKVLVVINQELKSSQRFRGLPLLLPPLTQSVSHTVCLSHSPHRFIIDQSQGF
eukprot:scaffold2798_cov160-Ochromonas_danica.AAC.15